MKHTKLTAILLSAMLLTSCGSQPQKSGQTIELTPEYTASSVTKSSDFVDAQYQFSLSMLQAAVSVNADENIALAPFSAAQTLAAAGYGAAGDTRTEIENAFGGMEISAFAEQLGGWVSRQDAEQLKSAASVWFMADSSFTLPNSYAQLGLPSLNFFAAQFNNDTLNDMNQWVSDATEGEVTKLMDELLPNEAFTLLNTLVFDAAWLDPYADNETYDGLFTAADGSSQSAVFMYKKHDDATILSDEKANGIMRDYQGGHYAFGALMPMEISLSEYVAQLTPESLRDTIRGGKQTEAETAIPQFAFSQSADLKPVFQAMGIESAFDESRADFSPLLPEGQLYLSRSLQQTSVQVNRHGTKASYAISIEGEVSSLAAAEIRLTKPFVWFIYDTKYEIPVMIGTVQKIS